MKNELTRQNFPLENLGGIEHLNQFQVLKAIFDSFLESTKYDDI